MFSSTAYEALYTYIGLHLHEASIKILTSYKFFAALMLMIFALTFFFTGWKYISRFLPSGLGGGGGASLGKVVKVIACLFIGMMVLRVDTQSSVSNYKNQSWHDNSYIDTRLSQPNPTYQVSFLFDILSTAAEEVARFATEVVDHLFIATNSQTESPDYFYKAVLYAGASTIEDPELKNKVSYYTAECFDLVIPLLDHSQSEDKLDQLFNGGSIAPILDKKTLRTIHGAPYTCLDLSREINQEVMNLAMDKAGKMRRDQIAHWGSKPNVARDDRYINFLASSTLVNHYLDQREGELGIHKGSKPPGAAANVFQYLNRLIGSWDGKLSMLGMSGWHGASQAASKAQEFSELLQRAPHIKGFTKLALIALFPWMVLFIIAGRWKILIYWTALYGSVLLWEPIWTLCYHIITHIALSTDAVSAFEGLSNRFSLYSAQLISSRMYYAYAIYSWVQIFVGPLPTLVLAFNMRSLLAESREESTPAFVSGAKSYMPNVPSQPKPDDNVK